MDTGGTPVFIIELHDGELDNTAEGTAAGHFGRRGGIAEVHDVEQRLQDPELLLFQWRRAYVLRGGTSVVAVLQRCPNNDMQYVARQPVYRGSWELPFLFGDGRARVVTGIFGTNANTFEQATTWAKEQLRDPAVATAVMLRSGKVFAAWEPSLDGIALITRAP